MRSWVEAVLGGPVTGTERTVPFGEARVWELRRDGGVVAWLKRHRTRDKARRERHAYEQWVPAVGWGAAPWLGACPDAPAWTLTGAAPGERADRARLSATERETLYGEIGRFLAALHAVPYVDDDPIPLTDAMATRCGSWTDRAAGLVDDDAIEAVTEAFAAPLPPLVRVPCHRDLGLHNVLVDTSGPEVRITVIDFGQARADAAISDLVKLFPRATEVQRADADAFFGGYGRRLDAAEAKLLARLRALHGLATWVWAAEHGDANGIRLGRRTLEEALAGGMV